MARRRNSSGDWLGSLGVKPAPVVREIQWPTVSQYVPTAYISAFYPAHLVSRPYLYAEDVDTILHNCRSDAISAFLSHVQVWTARPPVVVGVFPYEPEVPYYEPVPEAQPEPQWSDYEIEPPQTGLSKLLDGITRSHSQRTKRAKEEYSRAHSSWLAAEEPRKRLIAENEGRRMEYLERKARYDAQKRTIEDRHGEAIVTFDAERQQFNKRRIDEIELLSKASYLASDGDADSIVVLAKMCFARSPLPSSFPRSFEAVYDPASRLLAIEVEVPSLDFIPLEVELKTKRKPATDKERRRCQEQILYAMPLRVIWELFSCPQLAHVDMIAVNAVARFIDKKDGQTRSGILSSVAARRAQFATINIKAVDAKTCFRSLKGIAVPSLETITPVPPVISFDKNDKRIIQAERVLDNLSTATNLAEMPWDDFEHLVRELFEKEFLSRSPGAEVKVTRASRDWGVDAIIFDPDPLHGGKWVIQAKRYTIPVDVGAVRDLYGTVVNEGANRGILVTTSGFGPESHEFALSKPLTLINGAGLLALFAKHGYQFTIDLKAARAKY